MDLKSEPFDVKSLFYIKTIYKHIFIDTHTHIYVVVRLTRNVKTPVHLQLHLSVHFPMERVTEDYELIYFPFFMFYLSRG